LLLIDLHLNTPRQGPGSDAQTRLAKQLAGLDRSRHLNIADIGCGSGASARLLAREQDAHVTAVDFSTELIDELMAHAGQEGIGDRITPLVASMDDLPFGEGSFDVIWSEGAVYIMGFEEGVTYWKKFLKPGGILVVSEIIWLKENRPAQLQAYWDAVYSEMDTASGKMRVIENAGYIPKAYFTLPSECWTKEYYAPLKERISAFLDRNAHSPEAQAVVDETLEEIALFEEYGDWYSYGVFVGVVE